MLRLQPLHGTAFTTGSAALHRRAADLLSPAEFARARAMNTGAAADFVAGRLAQRDFAGSLLGVPPSSLTPWYSCPQCGEGPGIDHGRPGYLLDGVPAPLLLSASRAAGWVLLAAVVRPAAGLRLGVDLEETAKTGFDGFDDVALTSAERDFLGSLPPDAKATGRTRLWARKEAWLKMTGEGLRADPSGLDVLDRPGLTDVELSSAGPSLDIAGRPPSGLVGALALG